MDSLLLGFALFFSTHSISIIAPKYRDKLVLKYEKGYKAVYTVLSLTGLYFIVTGYAALKQNPELIYVGVQSLRPLVSVLMLLGFILFWVPYLPGKIKSVTKNPQLLSVILWSSSHLLVNGTLADILLFGSFLVWAIIDLISMKKRQQRVFSAIKASWLNDVIAIVIGTSVYFLFAKYLHGFLIGVPLMR